MTDDPIRAALERAAARMRAIPLRVTGPATHPDMRFAAKAVEIAEAMRAECLRALWEDAAAVERAAREAGDD